MTQKKLHSSAADRQWLRRQDTWRWGPTFDIRWVHSAQGSPEDLLLALQSDPEIDWHALDDLAWVQDRSSDCVLFAWRPARLPEIGACVDLRKDHWGEQHMWIYPPHVDRATGTRDIPQTIRRLPRVNKFLQACLGLGARIALQSSARAVMIADEVNSADPRDGFIQLWPPLPSLPTNEAGWTCIPLEDNSTASPRRGDGL